MSRNVEVSDQPAISRIPNFARKRLSTLWMSAYAEMRINSEQKEKLETVYLCKVQKIGSFRLRGCKNMKAVTNEVDEYEDKNMFRSCITTK
ncbi:hypothetical protein ANCCAN_00328 [Ancylostoma caninum]|uniref:Uncharacterized protein n=1 Tax=Ancylostoma caninum TaxID=29170 RepID=A0A368HC39_ANCCA|nr:hypothetical protein ANCCAN_00328 [Ancylostoma caninum]